MAQSASGRVLGAGAGITDRAGLRAAATAATAAALRNLRCKIVVADLVVSPVGEATRHTTCSTVSCTHLHTAATAAAAAERSAKDRTR